MSDIEDGELFSSDEEECLQNESCLKFKFNNDKNNNIEVSDSNQWDYEQKNIKIDKSNNQSESNHGDKKPILCTSLERNKERDRKRTCKSNDYDESYKKRKSDNNYVDHKYKSSHSKSPKHSTLQKDSHHNDINIHSDYQQPKRRILCKYYAAGDCKNGKTCGFMHEEFPCKFFHDNTTTCRAGKNCKYSHDLLTDEMKLVLDGFIHEGKDKTAPITIQNKESFIAKLVPLSQQSRPNCLLPTPTFLKSMHVSSYDPDFTEAYHEIANYPDNDYTEPSRSFENIPNYPIANKSKFLLNFPKPGSEDFERSRQNIAQRNIHNPLQTVPSFNRKDHTVFQRPYVKIEKPDINFSYYNLHSDSYNQIEQPFVLNDENVVPSEYDDVTVDKPLNYKIHAPARFIVGDQSNIKTEAIEETQPNLDTEFKDAIWKLAEQVVSDAHRRSPSIEKNVQNDSPEKAINDPRVPNIDTSHILKNVIKTEAIDVRINETFSIYKPENEMSDSDKKYIEEMKSLINLDAQFENVIPWKLRKLQIVRKQPYILYILKVNELHDNPLADPRLIGHPVLNFTVKKEMQSPTYGDGDEYLPSPIENDKEIDAEDFKDPYLNEGVYIKREVV